MLGSSFKEAGRWLLSFHFLSTDLEIRNTLESQRFNLFPFQQGFLPRPRIFAYQQPVGSQGGVEAAYPPPSDAQQVNNKDDVLKQSKILAGI